MEDRPVFGALKYQGLCHLCSAANTTQSFTENKFRNKKPLFGLRKKHISYNFYLWEIVYNRDSIQFCVRMELNEKKFPNYENCMISIFGQPEQVETAEVHRCQIISTKAETDHTQCGTKMNIDFNHQYIQKKTKIKQG